MDCGVWRRIHPEPIPLTGPIIVTRYRTGAWAQDAGYLKMEMVLVLGTAFWEGCCKHLFRSFVLTEFIIMEFVFWWVVLLFNVDTQ